MRRKWRWVSVVNERWFAGAKEVIVVARYGRFEVGGGEKAGGEVGCVEEYLEGRFCKECFCG